jgi:predicted ribosome quality control (RQC) complex YloA/Tae2 family protein
MSSLRTIKVGSNAKDGGYTLPPPAPGLDPDQIDGVTEWRDTVLQIAAKSKSKSIVDACVRGFRGTSPSLMYDMCSVANIPPSLPAVEVNDQQYIDLYNIWMQWIESVKSSGGRGLLLENAACCNSSTGAVSMIPGRYSNPVSPDLLTVVRKYYGGQNEDDEFYKLQSKLQKGIKSAMSKMEKKIESLEKQGAQGDLHLETQKLADMLMANVHRWRKGMTEIDMDDWDDPEGNTRVTVGIEQGKNAIETAEGFYKKARKQRRAADQVAPLLEAARSQQAYLSEVELMLGQLEGIEDLSALMEVELDLVAGGFIKPRPEAALAEKAASKAKKAQKKGGASGKRASASSSSSSSSNNNNNEGYRRYTSPSGHPILIGRNSRQNDELTMRLAKSGDVWMHARGVPGAHLLLRLQDKKEAPSDEDIQYAADLAIWFSKSREERRADVTCADPKDIDKPKGAKPGQVMVRKEWVVVGRPGQSVACGGGSFNRIE